MRALAGQLLYADVHGVPIKAVLCLVLAADEAQPKVLVVLQGLRIISYATNITLNWTVHRQQQQAALTIWRRYRDHTTYKKARNALAPAIMHWAFKPGGPLQRLHAVRAKPDFGTRC